MLRRRGGGDHRIAALLQGVRSLIKACGVKAFGRIAGFGSAVMLLATAAAAQTVGAVATAQTVGAGGPRATGGAPAPWQMGMDAGFSPVKNWMAGFHDWLLYLTIGIVLLVTVLLGVVIFRFRASRHPTPSKTTHNTAIEIIWTITPALILLAMFIPSIRLLYFLDRTQQVDLTVKVTGHQWYWNYEYPDFKGMAFDSNLVQDQDLKPGEPRLYTVDNRLVVPVGAKVRVLVTSGDVMHAWFVPPLGVQIYAVPGRSNETWLEADRAGVFYGQCNQICGVNHGYMPITVEAMSKDAFAAWAAAAQKKYAVAASDRQYAAADAAPAR